MAERNDAQERLARIEREMRSLAEATAELKRHADAAAQRLVGTPPGQSSAEPVGDTTPMPIIPVDEVPHDELPSPPNLHHERHPPSLDGLCGVAFERRRRPRQHGRRRERRRRPTGATIRGRTR
jgi:hypothetical protein